MNESGERYAGLVLLRALQGGLIIPGYLIIVKDGKIGKLQLKIATKEATEVDAPGPITTTKSGKGVLVG